MTSKEEESRSSSVTSWGELEPNHIDDDSDKRNSILQSHRQHSTSGIGETSIGQQCGCDSGIELGRWTSGVEGGRGGGGRTDCALSSSSLLPAGLKRGSKPAIETGLTVGQRGTSHCTPTALT